MARVSLIRIACCFRKGKSAFSEHVYHQIYVSPIHLDDLDYMGANLLWKCLMLFFSCPIMNFSATHSVFISCAIAEDMVFDLM